MAHVQTASQSRAQPVILYSTHQKCDRVLSGMRGEQLVASSAELHAGGTELWVSCGVHGQDSRLITG